MMNDILYQRVKDGLCELKVYVFQRPHMRDTSLEYELYIGRQYLDNIFEPNPTVDETTTEIFLSFPERWLNIVEERSLFNRIGLYYPNIEKLTIKTHSVYIIQCCPNHCVFIVQSPEFDGTLPRESDEGLLYLKTSMNLFNAGSINIVGGSKK